MKKAGLFLIAAIMIAALSCSRDSDNSSTDGTAAASDIPGSAASDSNIIEANDWTVEGFEDSANMDYTLVYQAVIDQLKSEYEGIIIYYAIFDINNNGIPELLVKLAYNEYNVFFSHIYTIRDRLPVLLFEPPYSRYGSSVILRNGLIDATAGDYAIYKISDDGYSVTKIAHRVPYDYPDEASLALAQWRYYVNNSEVDYDYYVQYLREQGYIIGGENSEADIDWRDLQ